MSCDLPKVVICGLVRGGWLGDDDESKLRNKVWLSNHFISSRFHFSLHHHCHYLPSASDPVNLAVSASVTIAVVGLPLESMPVHMNKHGKWSGLGH